MTTLIAVPWKTSFTLCQLPVDSVACPLASIVVVGLVDVT
jgi:hypothetical protein